MKKTPLLLLCFVLKYASYAQDTSTFFKVLPLPTISYSPETKTAYGVVSLFNIKAYKDTNTRLSNASLEFKYTSNKQIIFETDWTFFFNKEKWFSKGMLHYSKYPDLYFGIGDKISDTSEVQYSSNRFLVQSNALKSFGKGFFLGPTFRYIDYSKIEQTAGNSLFPELRNGLSTVSFGIEELWDRRDNILTPSIGHFMNVGVDYNLGANKNETYYRLKIDLRYYKKLSPTLTWSNRLFMRHASKNTAFFDLPMAGGDQFVRGFRLGKYRDFSLQTLQTEFRSKVYKSIGLALFGGITSLKKDAYREMNQSLKWNTGIGLRIRMDKKEQTNLRFDYALGSNNNSGFYVAFGESF